MAALLDSGFFFALVDEKDDYHDAVMQTMQKFRENVILPVPVITETAYLVNRESGAEKLAAFLDVVSETIFHFETPLPEDFKRAAEVLRK